MDLAGNVLTQYTYTLYGDLIHVDDLSGAVAAPVNRFLHQGLPLERFYAESGDDLMTDAVDTAPILLVINPATGESPLGLYYNRNRWYSPALGRFTSADPNATAMPIVTALAFNAEALDTLLSGLDAASHYGDGMNLYIYLGSNPVNRLDALGTFSYTEAGATVGVQGLLGGLLNCAMGGSFWQGAFAGAAGGAAGGLANFAFASASGLWATLAANAVVGAVDGGISAFAGTFYSTGDFAAALADARWGIAVGALTGGAVDIGARGLKALGIVRSGSIAALGRSVAQRLGGASIADTALVNFGRTVRSQINPAHGARSYWFRWGDIKDLTPEQIGGLIGDLASAGTPGGVRVARVSKLPCTSFRRVDNPYGVAEYIIDESVPVSSFTIEG